jgi:guanine deaminase
LNTQTLLRGRTLSFHRWPETLDDTAAYAYEEDGGVLIHDGKIAASGAFTEVRKAAYDGVTIIDHRPNLILPGFIDCHAHYPQMQVIASYGAELLEWLNRYTFPAESKFVDAQHARRIARMFLDELIRHGTTSVVAYCSVHKQSAEAFFAEAHDRNMLTIAGKVMMDRNAPEALRDTPQRGYDETKALIQRWRGKGRLDYAISPRFAPTSTDAQLEASGALVREHPEAYVQTHLCENLAEIAFVKELFPWTKTYTEVYQRYGLLSDRTVLGHCIHLEDSEVAMLAESGSVAAFCPTSNLFLGSGLFDMRRLQEHAPPARVALATDVGGGTSYSMLETANEAYKVLQMNGQSWPAAQAFYQMTLGNARALHLDDRIGALTEGFEADIIVLDPRATPAMAHRMEAIDGDLAEELFLLMTMGDDRAVVETYVAGRPAKGALS